jgi:hypothetical protein
VVSTQSTTRYYKLFFFFFFFLFFADSHAQALGECHAKYFTLGAAGARSKPCKA